MQLYIDKHICFHCSNWVCYLCTRVYVATDYAIDGNNYLSNYLHGRTGWGHANNRKEHTMHCILVCMYYTSDAVISKNEKHLCWWKKGCFCTNNNVKMCKLSQCVGSNNPILSLLWCCMDCYDYSTLTLVIRLTSWLWIKIFLFIETSLFIKAFIPSCQVN